VRRGHRARAPPLTWCGDDVERAAGCRPRRAAGHRRDAGSHHVFVGSPWNATALERDAAAAQPSDAAAATTQAAPRSQFPTLERLPPMLQPPGTGQPLRGWTGPDPGRHRGAACGSRALKLHSALEDRRSVKRSRPDLAVLEVWNGFARKAEVQLTRSESDMFDRDCEHDRRGSRLRHGTAVRCHAAVGNAAALVVRRPGCVEIRASSS
jgi:hypothetical protein